MTECVVHRAPNIEILYSPLGLSGPGEIVMEGSAGCRREQSSPRSSPVAR